MSKKTNQPGPSLSYVKYSPGSDQSSGFIGTLGLKFEHLHLEGLNNETRSGITEWVNYWIGQNYDGEYRVSIPKDKREGLVGSFHGLMLKAGVRVVNLMINEKLDKTKPFTLNAKELAERAAVKKAEMAGAKVKKVKKATKKKAKKKVSKKATAQNEMDLPVS